MNRYPAASSMLERFAEVVTILCYGVAALFGLIAVVGITMGQPPQVWAISLALLAALICYGIGRAIRYILIGR